MFSTATNSWEKEILTGEITDTLQNKLNLLSHHDQKILKLYLYYKQYPTLSVEALYKEIAEDPIDDPTYPKTIKEILKEGEFVLLKLDDLAWIPEAITTITTGAEISEGNTITIVDVDDSTIYYQVLNTSTIVNTQNDRTTYELEFHQNLIDLEEDDPEDPNQGSETDPELRDVSFDIRQYLGLYEPNLPRIRDPTTQA